jgi:hypothetical protein
MRLRGVQRDARADNGVSQWLVDWEDVLKDDKASLRRGPLTSSPRYMLR